MSIVRTDPCPACPVVAQVTNVVAFPKREPGRPQRAASDAAEQQQKASQFFHRPVDFSDFVFVHLFARAPVNLTPLKRSGRGREKRVNHSGGFWEIISRAA